MVIKTRQLLPARGAMPTGLSEWAVRQAVEERLGRAISHPQFRAYRARGLLGEPIPCGGAKEAEDRWPHQVVDRLVRIHELGKSVRSLDRRVILLRAESIEFRIPAQELRRAMIAILPSITAPSQKIKRLDKACRLWAEFSVAQATAEGLYARVSLPSGWRVPDPKTWDALLRTGSTAFFGEQAPLRYHSDNIMRMIIKQIDAAFLEQIEKIPLEERVTLLMIREMALWKTQGLQIPEEVSAQ